MKGLDSGKCFRKKKLHKRLGETQSSDPQEECKSPARDISAMPRLGLAWGHLRHW